MANLDDSQLASVFSKLTIVESARDRNQHKAVVEDEDIEEHDEEDEEQDGPFYVHIDILHNSQQRMATSINSYMLRKFYFDPRRYFGFFDDIFDPVRPNLSQMRTACGSMAPTYYELWKVKSDFSVQAFFQHLEDKGFQNTALRITCMYDGEHAIYRKEF